MHFTNKVVVGILLAFSTSISNGQIIKKPVAIPAVFKTQPTVKDKPKATLAIPKTEETRV